MSTASTCALLLLELLLELDELDEELELEDELLLELDELELELLLDESLWALRSASVTASVWAKAVGAAPMSTASTCALLLLDELLELEELDEELLDELELELLEELLDEELEEELSLWRSALVWARAPSDSYPRS